MGRRLLLAVLTISGLLAQTPASVVGTVVSVGAEGLSVKPDAGDPVAIAASDVTKVQRVIPGERDLSKAESITLADVAAGDRVLFRGKTLIVMTARAIAQRHDAEKQMWQQRGVLGVVEQVNGSELRITVRNQPVVVATTEKTAIRRYAPDSVRFADAVAAKLSDMRKGDQIRVLGDKPADAGSITAEQIVFGTFRTVAGTVSSVGADELTLKDLQNGRTLTVRTKPDSQLKKLTMQRPMMGADMSAMLDRLPQTTLAELKTGDTVIVSSTSGAKPNELTAIVLLAGAEPLITMLSARAEARRGQDPLNSGGQPSFDQGLQGMMGMPVQ